MVSSSAFALGGDAGSVADVQDVLFFPDSRPVLIRLHILVDGKPYGAQWTEYLTRWFHFLDRDDDGFLNVKEADRAPEPHLLEELFGNPFTYRSAAAPEFAAFDRDHDKKIALAEFLRYYRQSSGGPVHVAPRFQYAAPGVHQNSQTEMLYTLLDRDQDGKLSRSELENAEKILRKFDQNDDELLALAELQTAIAPPPLRIVTLGKPVVPALQVPGIPLMLVPREDAPRRIDVRLPVAREVLKHYDKNKNKALGRDEIALAKDEFDRLDADKDGELDLFELLRWMIAAPDAEAGVYLGRIEDDREPIAPLVGKTILDKKSPNTLAYCTPTHCVNLIAAASSPRQQEQPLQSARQVIVRQFQTIDRKGRGFLSKKQLRMPQFFYLHAIQDVADRDGDECLDLEELNAWLDLTTSGMGCQISVALAASGRGLFSALDANQDGRLSLRDLRYAWKRVSVYDRDGDSALARDEIPLQYQVVVNPGVPNYQAGQFGEVGRPSQAVPQSRRGPLWFRKMDKNGDGDVSPREFLGSRVAFRRLDTDGDGLIGLEEALRADAEFRRPSRKR